MAALFTRTSTPPSSPTTLSTISCVERLSETSASTAMQRPPLEETCSATRSASSRATSTAATAAPAAARTPQMPSPRPPPPPVTMATLPSRESATRTNLLASDMVQRAALDPERQRDPFPATSAGDDTQAAESQQGALIYANGGPYDSDGRITLLPSAKEIR